MYRARNIYLEMFTERTGGHHQRGNLNILNLERLNYSERFLQSTWKLRCDESTNINVFIACKQIN